MKKSEMVERIVKAIKKDLLPDTTTSYVRAIAKVALKEAEDNGMLPPNVDPDEYYLQWEKE